MNECKIARGLKVNKLVSMMRRIIVVTATKHTAVKTNVAITTHDRRA